MIIIKEIFKRIIGMDKENITIMRKTNFMMVSGKMIGEMDKGSTFGIMEICFKDFGKMI